jgi:hypothetical protein
VQLRIIILAVSIVMCAPPVLAQDRPGITLSAPDPARWDAAGHVAWVGVDKADLMPGDDWSGSAAFGASAGFYWTPHVKLEAAIAATTWNTVYVQQLSAGFPFRFGQYRFRSDHMSVALQYQFLENAWFHPFVGAGAEGVRETGRLTLSEQRPCPPSPCTPLPLAPESSVSYRVRPLLQTGFKGYASERVFIRGDIQVVFATGGVGTVRGHIGAGVDF